MKEKAQFYRTAGYVVSAAFTAALLVPLTMMLLGYGDKAEMEGEKTYERPDVSAKEFVTGDFQEKFELWFSTRYPGRSSLVNAYRQLGYDTSSIAGFDISTAFLPKYEPEDKTTTDTVDSGEIETDSDGETKTTSPYSDFNPIYAEINRRLYEREAVEPSGYKGNDSVVIGKGGYCFERAYINDLYGYSAPYNTVTDEELQTRVDMLSYIMDKLAERGIASYLVISPSKAAQYERFIPEWYKAQNIAPENYVQPIKRMLPMLERSGINYLYTPDLYKEIGLDETFPLTGIHWNKLAALEALSAVLNEYTVITGEETRHIEITGVTEQDSTSGFGNPEDDIYNIAYSGVNRKDSVTDDKYYIPEYRIVNDDCRNRLNILVSGGSFCWDFKHYLRVDDIRETKLYYQFYYNKWQGSEDTDPLAVGGIGRRNWGELLDKLDFIIFEANEQQAATMGSGVYDSLYKYFKHLEENS